MSINIFCHDLSILAVNTGVIRRKFAANNSYIDRKLLLLPFYAKFKVVQLVQLVLPQILPSQIA